MRSLLKILATVFLAALLVLGFIYYDTSKTYSSIQKEVLASNIMQYSALKESVFVISADDEVKEHFGGKDIETYLLDETKMTWRDIPLLQGVKPNNQAYYDAYRLVEGRLSIIMKDTWQYVWDKSVTLMKKVNINSTLENSSVNKVKHVSDERSETDKKETSKQVDPKSDTVSGEDNKTISSPEDVVGN